MARGTVCQAGSGRGHRALPPGPAPWWSGATSVAPRPGDETRRRGSRAQEAAVSDHGYRLSEIVGSSQTGAHAARLAPRPGGEPRRGGSRAQEAAVSDHVYRLSEIVGSSQTSVDDAIRTAIRKAAQTVRQIEWFETKEIRGQGGDGDGNYFQVRAAVGFRVED